MVFSVRGVLKDDGVILSLMIVHPGEFAMSKFFSLSSLAVERHERCVTSPDHARDSGGFLPG